MDVKGVERINGGTVTSPIIYLLLLLLLFGAATTPARCRDSEQRTHEETITSSRPTRRAAVVRGVSGVANQRVEAAEDGVDDEPPQHDLEELLSDEAASADTLIPPG